VSKAWEVRQRSPEVNCNYLLCFNVKILKTLQKICYIFGTVSLLGIGDGYKLHAKISLSTPILLKLGRHQKTLKRVNNPIRDKYTV
jgi:hypothetical protein